MKVQFAPCQSPMSAIAMMWALYLRRPPALAHEVHREREVQIVLEPLREADVPAPPELDRIVRDIGMIEVADQLEAEHARNAPRGIRVAWKIAVDLEGKEHRCSSQRYARIADGFAYTAST